MARGRPRRCCSARGPWWQRASATRTLDARWSMQALAARSRRSRPRPPRALQQARAIVASASAPRGLPSARPRRRGFGRQQISANQPADELRRRRIFQHGARATSSVRPRRQVRGRACSAACNAAQRQKARAPPPSLIGGGSREHAPRADRRSRGRCASRCAGPIPQSSTCSRAPIALQRRGAGASRRRGTTWARRRASDDRAAAGAARHAR